MKTEGSTSSGRDFARASWRMAALIALSLSAAGWPNAAMSQERGKILTLATQSNVTTLDPGGLGTLSGWEWLIALAP